MVQLFEMINQKYHTGEPALLSGPRTKDLAVKGFLDRCGNTLIKKKIKIFSYIRMFRGIGSKVIYD
jgi:hypothetical protein